MGCTPNRQRTHNSLGVLIEAREHGIGSGEVKHDRVALEEELGWHDHGYEAVSAGSDEMAEPLGDHKRPSSTFILRGIVVRPDEHGDIVA
jgi:hypothetical protein